MGSATDGVVLLIDIRLHSKSKVSYFLQKEVATEKERGGRGEGGGGTGVYNTSTSGHVLHKKPCPQLGRTQNQFAGMFILATLPFQKMQKENENFSPQISRYCQQ